MVRNLWTLVSFNLLSLNMGTFRNLAVLEQTRTIVKQELGEKYIETIVPFAKIIQKVMQANQIDCFTAMKKIKDTTTLYDKKNASALFSSALMEIVEDKMFSN